MPDIEIEISALPVMFNVVVLCACGDQHKMVLPARELDDGRFELEPPRGRMGMPGLRRC